MLKGHRSACAKELELPHFNVRWGGPVRYQSTLGLDDVEIAELVCRIAQVLRDRSTTRGRPRLLGLYRQVVLVLLYLRQNVSQSVLADMYGISQPTVSRIYRAVVPLLDQVLCLHEPELTSVFANREVIVDGTLVPTGNRAGSKHNYSSKRLRQGLNVQVAADADGTLLAVSAPVAGGRHDPLAAPRDHRVRLGTRRSPGPS